MISTPIWMASPPEVHSALLSSGPGPGALLAAAAQWSALSTEYASAAEELSGLLAAVQAQAWQGMAATEYLAAHLPYLAWLGEAGANSATTATGLETAAAAYSTAWAAMPTLAELAANHAAHAVLVATNFFGLNTIPIALNEADYARMWVQAAAVMSAYQAGGGLALASTQRTPPAPQLVRSDAHSAAATTSPFNGMITELEQLMEHPVQTIQQILSAFSKNPAAALTAWGPLLFVIAFNTVPWPLPFYLGPAAALALPVALGVGIAWLAQLADNAVAPGDISHTPAAPVTVHLPAPRTLPGAPASVPGPATTAPPAPAAALAGFGAPAPAVVPVTGAEAFGYLVAGTGPDQGFGPTLHGRGTIPAPPAAARAAAAAPNPAAEPIRRRRRRRMVLRDHADEFMDLDMDLGDDPGPVVATAASDRSAGPIGFAGTTHRTDAAHAAGLTTLAGTAFGARPTAPMVPGSRPADQPGSGAPWEGEV